MLMEWTQTEVGGGLLFSSQHSDYAIWQKDDKFFVQCNTDDRDDIGPLDDFKQAEDVVMKINICLTQYEEGLWKVMAAQAMMAAQPKTVSEIAGEAVDYCRGDCVGTPRFCSDTPRVNICPVCGGKR